MADPVTTLDRLTKAINTQKEEGGSAKNWWRWPLLILLVLVATAAFAWMSRRSARELAKLRHEKKKREVAIEQAKSDAIVDDARTNIKEYEEQIRASEERIKSVDGQIKRVEAQLEADKAAIDRIRTWDDVAVPPGRSRADSSDTTGEFHRSEELP